MAFAPTAQPAVPAAPPRGGSPLLRLQSDERLVTLTRRGNQGAYEVLVARYQQRLLAFCRHMLRSHEDAEDVLQEVFAAGYRAMVADDRPINVRPWLYRIARNRSLNHLRRQPAIGVDSMDIHLADNGTSTADRVHSRETFRELLEDVGRLAEQQRTALLLRELDDLSYEQIAEAMDTTVPAVKSLLVRARVGLADASQARALDCEEVRLELGEWSEGLVKRLSPPVRRHVKDCPRCGEFRAHLKANNKALAALFPVGPVLLLQQLLGGSSAGAGAGAAGAAGASACTGAGASGICAVSAGTVAAKAAAGLAAAAIVTGGAIEARHVSRDSSTGTAPVSTQTARAGAPAAAAPATSTPAPAATGDRAPAPKDVKAASASSEPAPPVPAPKQPAATPVVAEPAASTTGSAAAETTAVAAPITEDFVSATLQEDRPAPAPATPPQTGHEGQPELSPAEPVATTPEAPTPAPGPEPAPPAIDQPSLSPGSEPGDGSTSSTASPR